MRFWWLPKDVRETLIEHELAIIELQQAQWEWTRMWREHLDTLGGK